MNLMSIVKRNIKQYPLEITIDIAKTHNKFFELE